MENRAHALAAGMFVLILGVAVAISIWWFRQDRDALSFYLLETSKNVGGLNKEAVVRYRGIRAGKVEDIDIDPQNPRLILVKISLDQDFKLTKGTTASLASQGITGLAYIALEDKGTDMTPLTAPEGQLPRIQLKPTFLDSLSENAGDIMTQIAAISARLNAVLSDKNIENIEKITQNTAAASESLRELPQIMASIRTALSKENIEHLNKTLAYVEKTAGEAAPLTHEMRDLVRNFSQLSTRAEALLGSEYDAVQTSDSRSTVQRANILFDELTQTSRQLQRLLDTLNQQPQALIFGSSAPKPGPGEPGFAAQPAP